MNKFHNVDWKEKVNLIDKFSEERFQYFAECLIYEEALSLYLSQFMTKYIEVLLKDYYQLIRKSGKQQQVFLMK